MFTCCHPALAPEARIALTLRLLGGLSVLFLIFNEGYLASGDGDPIRIELTGEAIRLARVLHELMPDEPEVTGLLALLLLTDARREARVRQGQLVPLAEQLPLSGYHAWHATRADLLRRLGRSAQAKQAYDDAVAATQNSARARVPSPPARRAGVSVHELSGKSRAYALALPDNCRELREKGRNARAVIDEMTTAGVFVFSDGGLDASTVVCSVDPSSGSPVFTDGPFVETKEHLGGFAVVDVSDDEQARDWAGKIAVAVGWPQEVHRFPHRLGSGPGTQSAS